MDVLSYHDMAVKILFLLQPFEGSKIEFCFDCECGVSCMH